MENKILQAKTAQKRKKKVAEAAAFGKKLFLAVTSNKSQELFLTAFQLQLPTGLTRDIITPPRVIISGKPYRRPHGGKKATRVLKALGK